MRRHTPHPAPLRTTGHGGTFQFVWDTAVRAKVYRGIGVEYWFHHMSDASLYERDARGFDLHIVEVSYRF